ncbi:MAG: type 2 periplasmic-binding domain-containing protein, partial [Ruminiclostridium sp.]
WTGMMYYDMMVARAMGVDASNDALSGKTRFDSAGFLDVTKKFADLISMKAFDPGVVALGRYEAEMEFKMGKIPVLLEGSWVLGDVLTPEDSAIKDTAVVRGFPTMSGGTGTSATDVLGGANDGFIINASTKNPEEAFKVCSTILKSVSLSNYANNMGISAWKVPDSLDVSGVSPYFIQVKDIIEKSQASMLYWDNILNADLTQTHKNLVQDLYAQKISPEDFVKKMQEAIDSSKK